MENQYLRSPATMLWECVRIIFYNIYIDDDFEYKEEIFNILEKLPLTKAGLGAVNADTGAPLILLAIRFMMANKFHSLEGDVFGMTKLEDQQFMRMYLAYLS